MAKIERHDATYVAIESIADYELTPCVAYEMAIRNKEVIQLKKDIDITLELVRNDFLYAREHDTELTLAYNKLEEEYYIKCDDGDNNSDDLVKPDFRKYFIEHNQNTKIIREKLELLINKYWIRYFYESAIIDKAIDGDNMFLNFFEHQEKLKEHGFINQRSLFSSTISIKEENGEQILVQQHYVNSSKYEKSNQINIDKTLISQRIDSLVIPKEYDKRIDVKINLALPENELIAFIRALKKSYDSDMGMIKTPYELLGNELQKTNNIVRNNNGEHFDGKSVLSNQQRLADMFFIYDALKDGMTQRQIQNEIFNYYADKGFQTKTMDAKTLKKYKEIAIDYIDNERYKELVTGVKKGI